MKRRVALSTATENPVVYPITVPTSSSLLSYNFYLIKNNDSLCLIDAGMDTDKCWNHFMHELKENGFQINDIKAIILTHSHHDHTGLVNRILAVKHIPVYAHYKARPRLKREEDFIKQRIVFFQSLYSRMGCKENGDKQVKALKKAAKENAQRVVNGDILPLKDGDIIEGLKVIETPGHAPDHIVLLHQESGILMGGDHLIQHISSNALIEPDEQGEMIDSLRQYECSLKKCLATPLTIVYPGHGNIVNEPHTLIEKRIDGIQEKSEKIKALLSHAPVTAAQIAKIYYKEKYDREFSLVMSEIIGQLDRLESSKEIVKKQHFGEMYYYLSTKLENFNYLHDELLKLKKTML